jgi:K+/H+ antiporter YhaU regulatory subunit KhtT
MAARRRHGVPVVGERGLVGILTLSDLARAEAALTVGEAMTTRPVTVSPATPVSHALERMAVLGVGRLPVVAGDDPSRLVGMFRREDAVRAYHEALGAATGRHLDRERLRRRVEPDAAYYDFRVPPGSIADGRAVREVAWPEGSTLVSVRRGTEVLVPGGATVLVAGDVVTAFGSESSRRQTIERLNAGADEPTAEIEIGEISAGEGASPGQR